MNTKIQWGTGLALVAAGIAGAVLAGISGSAHDFSTQGWSGGKICLPCHPPHNAEGGGTPLWNHQTTEAIFTLYDSPTMDVPVGQPRPVSMLCLSCHDGTVAIDSFGGASGSTLITGSALLGTDLSHEHPISMQWQHQTINPSTSDCTKCHIQSPWGFNNEVPFFDGYVECASCHDVHNDLGLPSLLRKSMASSELCLYCHQDK